MSRSLEYEMDCLKDELYNTDKAIAELVYSLYSQQREKELIESQIEELQEEIDIKKRE